MIQPNQRYYRQSHSTIRLLASPTHLLFQLIRFTTLPYMICQIISNNNKNKNSNPIKTEVNSFIKTNHHPFSTLTPSDHFQSSLGSAKLFHHFIRSLDIHYQLINLLDQFLNITQPPKLNPKTVEHIFAIVRPNILHRLNQQHQNPLMQPQITTSTAWESEAMNQIVQMWHNQSRQAIPLVEQQSSSIEQQSDNPNHLPRTIRTLQKIQSRRRAFLSHGPPRCDCQRSPLPPRNLSLDKVGSLEQSTLAQFTQKLGQSINLLTYLRIIDLTRQAQRWDLAVIFLDQTRINLKSDQKNHFASRRLGQVTALLQFLRGDGCIEPETDPLKMWSVHFVCESIERNLKDEQHEWARINRLSLDVLTRFARMPIGFDQRDKPSQNSKTRQKSKQQQWPCLDFERHARLLDSIARSENELQFAVLTRQRCERLLSKLVRLVCHTRLEKPSSKIYSWSTKSVVQLRLLEYLAQQGTQQQFMSLLQIHLDQHPTSSKLAKHILLAAKRFKCLSENSELITQALSKCNHQDLRAVIDFILRPRQALETLNQNLNICLASLPAEKDARMKMYSHLIYRLSQLPTPSLALRVWETVNREERTRKLLKVGRRTRLKLKKLINSIGEEITIPVDKLPNQLIRSMVYVYRNLTHLSLTNVRNQFATGKNYRSLYARLSFKSKSTRARKWPITKELARSHLIFDLIKSEVDRVEDYKILKSLENSLLSSPFNNHDNHNCFENLIRFLLVDKIKGSELTLIKRFDQLQDQEGHFTTPSSSVANECKASPSKVRAKKRRKHASNDKRARINRLKFFKFVRDWIKSRGGFVMSERDHNQEENNKLKEEILIRRSNKIIRVDQFDFSHHHHSNINYKSLTLPNHRLDVNSQSVDSLPLHYNPPTRRRRRSCSRYWARIVADHTISSPSPNRIPL